MGLSLSVHLSPGVSNDYEPCHWVRYSPIPSGIFHEIMPLLYYDISTTHHSTGMVEVETLSGGSCLCGCRRDFGFGLGKAPVSVWSVVLVLRPVVTTLRRTLSCKVTLPLRPSPRRSPLVPPSTGLSPSPFRPHPSTPSVVV